MKKLLILLCISFTIFVHRANAQKITWKNIHSLIWQSDTDLIDKERKDDFLKNDVGSLWTSIPDYNTYGIIGDNMQRLKIKLITATKDTTNPGIYRISGKSMVKNNICTFSGVITVTSIHLFKNTGYLQQEYKGKKHGIIIGEYYFTEDSTQAKSGTFDGSFLTFFCVDKKGKVIYDSVELGADGFFNNQFVGTWKGYKTTVTEKCNWGDYRVPFSGKLDIGAGFFSPDDAYLQYGWQSLRDAIYGNDKAQKEEYREWWK